MTVKLKISRLRDVDIVFSGVRPGEKLFEELGSASEKMDTTKHPKILIGRLELASPEAVEAALGGFRELALDGAEPRAVRRALREFVPEATLQQ